LFLKGGEWRGTILTKGHCQTNVKKTGDDKRQGIDSEGEDGDRDRHRATREETTSKDTDTKQFSTISRLNSGDEAIRSLASTN